LASGQTAYPTTDGIGSAGVVVLEDEGLLVGFDVASGALTHLKSKQTGWSIHRRPELGISFRIHAPLPDRRDNFVLGQKQRAAEVRRLSANQVRLEWKNLNSEHAGSLPIAFIAKVTLENGGLSFSSRLINDSSVTIESVDYPYVGDLYAPTINERMTIEHLWYDSLVSAEIHPHFQNEKGGGVDFPIKTADSKQSLFCLIQAENQGLYVEVHDPTQRYLVQYAFAQHPGVLQGATNEVPKQDEISGLAVFMEFRTCHFVFAQPHSSMELIPTVLRPYRGDWHAGLDLYKEWRKSWFKEAHLAEWVKDVHSWQQIQIDGAEEDFTIPYRELGKYVDQCVSNGVKAIQLVGWNLGGQDRGNPSQDTDPGLGTKEELKEAIAQAQEKGVKIILFGKLTWADLSTDWYKTELYKYACTDPYGIPYQFPGYPYTTPTQLAGINTRRFAVMDFYSPAYRDIATKEFQKLLDLGGSGWLFDEVCHHGPLVDYSFSPDHGYLPPGYVYAGDIPMSQQLRKAADKLNPDFLFSGEAPGDWLRPYYPLSYFRISSETRPAGRYIDPKAPLMVASHGFDDREMLNMMLMYRYIISYEPYNFHGLLTDIPLTLAYGKKIDALRREYREYLWDAEFRDTLGAQVSGEGAFRYSVFETKKGKRGVVVVNNEPAKSIAVTVKVENPGEFLTATPEQPEAEPSDGKVTIAARSAAVLMEQ
jgi:hypothetical protein